MKELEENYGIYLDADTFIKEMNQKLNEIKSYSEMYNYFGSDFGKGKNDLEIIIESYEGAKLKGNLHDKKSTNNENGRGNPSDGIEERHGRGGGGGERGGRGGKRGRGRGH